MKLTIFFIAVAFFQVQASSTLAQTVTISGKEMSLKQVFSDIEKQTDYVLMYNKGTFDGAKPVTLSVYQMPLREFLSLVLKDQQLEFDIQGKTILLSRTITMAAVDGSKYPGELKVHPTKEPIVGGVLNDKGLPLSGVSIFSKRTGKGTYSDAAGRFSIQGNIGDTLLFSMVGYSDQPVKILANNMVIRMKLAHSVLDELQFTVYGKTSKRLTTGSISTITSQQIEKLPVFNALEVLAGRAPGVTVQQRNGNSAGPISVIIRGIKNINSNVNHDPLYVVDGLPISNMNISPMTGTQNTSMGTVQAGLPHTFGENVLNRINPDDIETITILSGADATAIYGSRGANGVILIKTKKGKAGPASLSFSTQNGITMAQRYPRLMNTKDYLAVRREAFKNDGLILNRENAPDLLLWDSTRNEDWQRLMVGTGVQSNSTLAVSGGTGQFTYRVSAGHGSITTLLNADGKNQRLSFSSSMSYTSPNQKFTIDLENMVGSTFVRSYAVSDPSNLPPNAPSMYDKDGLFNYVPYRRATGTDFPFFTLRQSSESNSLSFQNKLGFQYKLLRGLSMNLSAQFLYSTNDNVRKLPESSYDPLFFKQSSAYFGISRSKSWQIRHEISYETFISQGNFNFQLVSEYAPEQVSGETVSAELFPNDAMMKSWINATRITPLNSRGYNKNLKFTAILGYNWKGKYIFSFTGTRDGSPHFGAGKRFGNFGSAALAWNLSEEKWMKSILPSWVSFLKIRGDYGINGSSVIPAYENISHWSKGIGSGSINERALQPYNGTEAFHMIKPMNRDFHWVNTYLYEWGIETSFFKDRLNANFTLYQSNSTEQLGKVDIPNYTGFSSLFTNTYANLRNKGWTITANGTILQNKNLSISATFNISRNRNKLIDYRDFEYSSQKGRLKIGYSTSTVFVLRYTGINPLNGSYTFEDYNKDGRIAVGGTDFPTTANDDRYIPIEKSPKFTGGGDFYLTYKSFSLGLGFEFANILRADPYVRSIIGGKRNSPVPAELMANHWKQPGDIVKYPRFTTGSDLGPLANSTAAFINGSYFTVNALSLGWNIPQTWLKKIKLKSASLGMNTSNIFNLSPFKGFDPKTSDLLSPVPIPRTISTRLSLTF